MSQPKRRRASTEAKLHRIQALQTTGINNTKLLSLVKRIKEKPAVLDEVTSLKMLDTATFELFDAVKAEAHRFALDDGSEFVWEFASARKCLAEFTRRSANFKDMLASLHARTPCTMGAPWHWIVYFDETTPGQVLRQDNRRKTWAFYVSIRELGPAVLQHEAAWLPIAILRSSVSKTIIGRFSGCMKVFFSNLLIADGNLRTDGLVLRLLRDEPVLIFVTMGNILSDAAALKDLWCVKGAGGLIPCSFCVNICGADDGEDTLLGHDDSHRIFDIRCRNPQDFVIKSSGDWYVQADTLQALQPRLSAADFELVQKAYGMTYNQHGIIYDLGLRPLMPPCGDFAVRSHALHLFKRHRPDGDRPLPQGNAQSGSACWIRCVTDSCWCYLGVPVMQRSKERLENGHPLGEQGEALLKKEIIVSERFGHAACHSIIAFFW